VNGGGARPSDRKSGANDRGGSAGSAAFCWNARCSVPTGGFPLADGVCCLKRQVGQSLSDLPHPAPACVCATPTSEANSSATTTAAAVRANTRRIVKLRISDGFDFTDPHSTTERASTSAVPLTVKITVSSELRSLCASGRMSLAPM